MSLTKKIWTLGLTFSFVFVSLTAVEGQLKTTQIIKFVPDISVRGDRSGNCWTGSIAAQRPDAWRCMIGNGIFDPCFASPEGEFVVCDPNPAKGKPGFRLNLTEPLPRQDMPVRSPEAGTGSGWLVELADGTLCQPVTGASGLVGGKTISYYCENGKKGDYVSILGDLDARKPLWTAEKATTVEGRNGPKLIKSKKMAVSRVWQ
jgi:hypothetical protein